MARPLRLHFLANHLYTGLAMLSYDVSTVSTLHDCNLHFFVSPTNYKIGRWRQLFVTWIALVCTRADTAFFAGDIAPV